MKFGEILAPDRLRIYLTGTVCLKHGRTLVDERQFPARQGRLAFAYLVCERFRLQSLELPATTASITSRSGRYQLQLPSETWVDIEAAAQALDEAEGSLRAGAIERASGQPMWR
jgi:hypothetical protein